MAHEFDPCFEAAYRRVSATFHFPGFTQEQCEDAIQQAALERWCEFEIRGCPRWACDEQGRPIEQMIDRLLWRRGHDRLVDEYRRIRRRPTSELDDQLEHALPPARPFEEKELESWQARTELELIERESPILLDVAVGLTVREMAEKYGCTETAIKVRIHRARARVRPMLERLREAA